LVKRPGDAEFGIVPDHTALTGRVVAASSLVEDFGGLGQDEESMRKAFRNPEELDFSFFIAGLEIECGPSSKVGRFTAEIHGDVPDVAGKNADEFSLGMTELVVEAAEHAACGKRLVILSEGRGKTERSKGVRVEEFGEPTTVIAVAPGLQNLYIAK
jgi:hypothetical protein